ncbi:MAG: Cyclohexadienyl dehydratase precursor [Pseudomonadota bacterium]|jgi:Na+/H+-dicarboxylate symporter/ABC-type amino acid transport substrate-binding protein
MKSFSRPLNLSNKSLTHRILVALGLGLFMGVFLGEKAATFQILGTIYIGLMQMAVLPYIIFSLILAIGRLNFQQMKKIILTSAVFFVGFYLVAATVVVIISTSFPPTITSHTLELPPLVNNGPGDLLNLFIPSNPFRALAENAVPAVVLFSLLFGFAVINLPNKDDLLKPLQVIVDGLKQVNAMVLLLTPLGIFGMAANLAGTMTLEELHRLQAYYLTFGFAVLLLSFVVLPALVALSTPFTYREVIASSRNAMLTAFVTGSVFPVMPLLSEGTRTLLEKIPPKSDNNNNPTNINDVLLPLAYPFPSSNNVVDLLFIPFAAWFIGKTLSLFDAFTMVGSGFFLLFGKVYLTIPFLLNYFHLPENLFQVFLGAGVLAARMGDFLGPMHYYAFVLITASYLRGYFEVRWRLAIPVLVSVLIPIVIGISVLNWQINRIDEKATQAQNINLLPTPTLEITAPLQEVEARENPTPLLMGESRLQRILRRGILRVGFRENQRPFSYRDSTAQLIGIDIDLIHRLAAELNVSIEVIPFELDQLAEHFKKDHFDVAIAGIQDSIQVYSSHRMSEPYLSARVAVITKDYQRENIENLDGNATRPEQRWSVDQNDIWAKRLAKVFPQATIIPMETIIPFFTDARLGLEGLITTDIIALSWMKVLPGFAIQYPEKIQEHVTYGFAIAGRDSDLTGLINEWIEIKKQDRTIEKLQSRWVRGQDPEKSKPPRWSIASDVLGWDIPFL